MKINLSSDHRVDPEIYEPVEREDSQAGLSRREFVQVLGAGLLITVTGEIALAQRRGGRGGGGRGGFGGRGPASVAARLHIDRDGSITVMTGKVEAGQGSRAEITQAAAEELRVDPARIRLIMADTALAPDDGVTAGSRTTPSTIPSVRSGAAAARELLLELASQRWKVDRATLRVRDGAIAHEATKRTISYAELAQAEDFAKTLARPIPANVAVTPVKEWKVLGTSLPRPNRRDIVTGAHRYPSDILRPGMFHGKILRPPAFGATLASIDLAPAQSMAGVAVMRDGSLVGCAAATSLEAQRAVEALAKTAKWQTVPQPVSSKDLFAHFRKRAREDRWPAHGRRICPRKTVLHESYEIAYIQHAPMEPRAAVAEWDGDKLTVWTGTQNPFGVRGELAAALGVPAENVRVIVPDMGGGFGGKHSGEAAVEAARLARAAETPGFLALDAGRGVHLGLFPPRGPDRDPRRASTRPARSWPGTSININPGGSGVESPYAIPQQQLALGAGRRAAAAGLLSGPGRHGQPFRPRVVHGRVGPRGPGRSAGIPFSPSEERPFAGRAGKGRQGVRLGRAPGARVAGGPLRTSAWGWPAGPKKAPTWRPAPRSRSTAATARSESAMCARHSSAARS